RAASTTTSCASGARAQATSMPSPGPDSTTRAAAPGARSIAPSAHSALPACGGAAERSGRWDPSGTSSAGLERTPPQRRGVAEELGLRLFLEPHALAPRIPARRADHLLREARKRQRTVEVLQHLVIAHRVERARPAAEPLYQPARLVDE